MSLNNKNNQRVVVAMSGGVDSSVAAALLKEEGYEVIGVTLQLRHCTEDSYGKTCCGIGDDSFAAATAEKLGFPHYKIDCVEQFETLVLKKTWDEYSKGRTPNPCILCNHYIKFGFLLDYAEKIGASKIATGHHSEIVYDELTDKYSLKRGKDSNKDQTYFLFTLGQKQLKKSLMPIGRLTKNQVREIARKLNLTNADKAESQDACFIVEGETSGGFAEALKRRFNTTISAGNILDTDFNILGKHKGIHRFTIGQRKGLGIAIGKPAYVIEIKPGSNEVIISDNSEDLFNNHLIANVKNDFDFHFNTNYETQIRYRHKPVDAQIISAEGNSLTVKFNNPQRAITPGQAVVFYDNDILIGGAWIDTAFNNS